ncbi:unnamed protein product [Boreogadus saida]
MPAWSDISQPLRADPGLHSRPARLLTDDIAGLCVEEMLHFLLFTQTSSDCGSANMSYRPEDQGGEPLGSWLHAHSCPRLSR